MRPAAILIFLTITIHAAGQPVQEIAQLLQEKSFAPFNHYIENPRKTNTEYYWEMLRTIVGDYHEGVVNIREYLPFDSTRGNINNYSIQLLASNDRIFYYRFTKTIAIKKGPDKYEPVETTVDSFSDAKEYGSFENQFKQVYGDDLNRDELFLSIVYGSSCGIAGMEPEYLQRLNWMLRDKNLGQLRNWLKSPNAEKQLYAIRGYRVLVEQGYSPTDEETRWLHFAKNRKGKVYTCNGCLYGNESYQDVVAEIRSMPVERFMPGMSGPAEFLPVRYGRSTASFNWWLLALGLVSIGAAAYFIRKRRQHG